MNTKLEWLADGGVTSPAGWQAGAVYAGIKNSDARGYGTEPRPDPATPDVGRLDLAMLASDGPCTVAGVFTRNAIVGHAVRLTRERLEDGAARALIVNSGIANTVTGEQGERDAQRMGALAAARAGVPEDEMLVASTGVIGRPLPMDLIERGIAAISLSPDGGGDFSRAIMTTDTVPKQAAVRVTAAGRSYIVGGTAKGSGMIHPDMATCFCFLTTDAPAALPWLRQTLREVADLSINMIDVDTDTSTSDTMLLLAGGAAGGEPVDAAHPAAPALRAAVEAVAVSLARQLARDGEGARTLIEVVVQGAASMEDARRAARTVSSSPLVKTMVTGRDPNWGRVMMAIGRSGAQVRERSTSVWIGDHCALQSGTPTDIDPVLISEAMDREEMLIRVDLGLGEHEATAWGCDLTEEYVRINADYTT